MKTTKPSKLYFPVKHAFDFTCALIGLILSGWLILLCMLAIKLSEPGAPVFYNSKRIGKNRKVFLMFKLRTMTYIQTGLRAATEDTLTPVGKIVRKLSLDELPQLFNILRGEMSFIGPRPMPLEYGPHFTELEELRHTVRPGISGLAQVNGRSHLNWDRRFAYDVEYVQNLSLVMDFKLIVRTFSTVFTRKHVIADASSEITMSFADWRIFTAAQANAKECTCNDDCESDCKCGSASDERSIENAG
ncbi:MAG: sugar transferase [Oscillospiraceae bacterium]|jgi:undecaprenyl phosphate N,N'-diacetylbacillosamine 1-phosphate transferase|nr:sugar transferase [Oscillospiraceae bacterium]